MTLFPGSVHPKLASFLSIFPDISLELVVSLNICLILSALWPHFQTNAFRLLCHSLLWSVCNFQDLVRECDFL